MFWCLWLLLFLRLRYLSTAHVLPRGGFVSLGLVMGASSNVSVSVSSLQQNGSSFGRVQLRMVCVFSLDQVI